MICQCSSSSFVRAGLKRLTGSRYKQRYQCTVCGKYVMGEEVKKNDPKKTI